jgi:hypothetical protein
MGCELRVARGKIGCWVMGRKDAGGKKCRESLQTIVSPPRSESMLPNLAEPNVPEEGKRGSLRGIYLTFICWARQALKSVFGGTLSEYFTNMRRTDCERISL